MLDHVVIRTGIVDDRIVVNIGNMGTDRVQKVAIVRDHNQCPFVVQQKLFQPVDCLQVHVVRRFVQKQRFRAAEQSLGKKNTELVIVRQGCHQIGVLLIRDPDPAQDGRGFDLCDITVFIGNQRL